MDNDQFAQFLEMKTDIASIKTDMGSVKHTLSGNGGPGLMQAVAEHDRQIAFWKGSIALMGFLVLVFGAVLLMHIMGGK